MIISSEDKIRVNCKYIAAEMLLNMMCRSAIQIIAVNIYLQITLLVQYTGLLTIIRAVYPLPHLLEHNKLHNSTVSEIYHNPKIVHVQFIGISIIEIT